MTHLEYDNTVRDLVGETSNASASFPPDERMGTFDNDAAGQQVSRLLAEGYLGAAERRRACPGPRRAGRSPGR
mgnify:CR=1 FL=1